MKKSTQAERLLTLLSDGSWHDTVQIQYIVYGDEHLGLSRVGARIHDLKKKGHMIEGRHKSQTIYEYRLVPKEIVQSQSQADNDSFGNVFNPWQIK